MLSRLGRRTVAALALIATLGVIGYGANARTHTPSEHPAEHGGHATGELLVTSPLRTDTELTRDYVCQIRAIRHIEVRALERGYLEEVFVDEGKSLSEGQPMFQIMPTLYQAELDKAKAEAEAARIEYENTRLLAEKDVVSANELALTKAKLDKANAELALSEAHRRLTAINAPFGGIMGLLEVRRGSLLDEGELLTTLSDNSTMWVYFNVTEGEYLEYAARSAGASPPKVELVLANNEVFGHSGTIETIAADFNNETGTIAFRATFPNPAGLLRHGETGNVRLTTPLPGALLIPQQATFEVLDHRYVFVVDEQGVVRQRRITVAEELPHLFVVADGLGEGDKLLLEGLRKVQDGQAVVTKFQAPSEVFAHLDLPAD
jgi:membrane fusion protein (multidrug efflux system)